MQRIQIPWTWTFGNHDHTYFDRYSPQEITNMLSESSMLVMDKNRDDIYGYTNGEIRIYNSIGDLSQVVVNLDSGGSIDDESGAAVDYDYIHDSQVNWYESVIQRDNSIAGNVVNSFVFTHIPLQEYRDAWAAYVNGDTSVKYISGTQRETVCCSNTHSSLFDKMVELNSTKVISCGHDHVNDYSLMYKGINLVYSKSIDYVTYPGIAEKTEQRGCTLFQFGSDGAYTLTSIQ